MLNKKYLPIILPLMVLMVFTSRLQAGNKSLIKVGNDVHIEEDMRVEDAVAIGGDLYIDGIVDRDAVAVGGKVHLGENAVVHRDVVIIGGSIDQAEGALIYGSTVDISSVNLENIFEGMEFSPRFMHIPRGLKILPIIGLFALVLLLAVIMPKELNKISSIAKNEPMIMFLWGLLGVILILPLAVMLVISIIGIALIPLEILAIFLASLIGYIAVSMIIGKKILKAMNSDDPNIIISALLGVLLLWLIGLIPILGALVKVIACTIGFGSVITAVIRRNKKDEGLVVEENK